MNKVKFFKEISKNYKNLEDLRQAFPSEYESFKRIGILEDLCPHMSCFYSILDSLPDDDKTEISQLCKSVIFGR